MSGDVFDVCTGFSLAGQKISDALSELSTLALLGLHFSGSLACPIQLGGLGTRLAASLGWRWLSGVLLNLFGDAGNLLVQFLELRVQRL